MQSPPITPETAEEWLQDDLDRFEEVVDTYINVDTNENQWAALVSITFNCGAAPLLGHLGAYVNASNWQQAADEFLKWDNAGGQMIPGLQRRREAERALFLLPTNNPST